MRVQDDIAASCHITGHAAIARRAPVRVDPQPAAGLGNCGAAGLFALAGSFILFAQVLNAGVISYHIGNWAPPWGIEFRLDAANSFVLVVVSLVGAVCILYGRRSIEREIPEDDQPLFYTMLLLCFAGMLGVAAPGDAFNLFVFLEIFSLSSYVLVAMGAGRDRRALTAAFTYLLLGTIGATFYVIGLGFVYALTGTLNMADHGGADYRYGRQRHPAGGVCVYHYRHGPEAGDLSAASVAAERLYLCPIHGVPRFLRARRPRWRFMSCCGFLYTVFSPAFPFRSPNPAISVFAAWAGGNFCRIDCGAFSARCKTPAGLFQHRPVRLFSAGCQFCQYRRADGDALCICLIMRL